MHLRGFRPEPGSRINKSWERFCVLMFALRNYEAQMQTVNAKTREHTLRLYRNFPPLSLDFSP